MIVQQLDEEIKEWTSKEVIAAKKKLADEFFTKNIKDPEIQLDPKNWHKSLQTFSNYKSSQGMLNLHNGPVAHINDWKEA